MKINYELLPYEIKTTLDSFKIDVSNSLDMNEVSMIIQSYIEPFEHVLSEMSVENKVLFANRYPDIKLFLIQVYQDIKND